MKKTPDLHSLPILNTGAASSFVRRAIRVPPYAYIHEGHIAFYLIARPKPFELLLRSWIIRDLYGSTIPYGSELRCLVCGAMLEPKTDNVVRLLDSKRWVEERARLFLELADRHSQALLSKHFRCPLCYRPNGSGRVCLACAYYEARNNLPVLVPVDVPVLVPGFGRVPGVPGRTVSSMSLEVHAWVSNGHEWRKTFYYGDDLESVRSQIKFALETRTLIAVHASEDEVAVAHEVPVRSVVEVAYRILDDRGLPQEHPGNCPAHFWSLTKCVFENGRCVA